MKAEGGRRNWPKEAKKIKDGGEKKDSSAGGLILFCLLSFFSAIRGGRVKGEGGRRNWPKEAKKIKDGDEMRDSSAGGLNLFCLLSFFWLFEGEG